MNWLMETRKVLAVVMVMTAASISRIARGKGHCSGSLGTCNAASEAARPGFQHSIPTMNLAGGLLTGLVLVVMVVLVNGCGSMSSVMKDMDRDYNLNYDATSGRGGVQARWTPAMERGQGRPSVGVAVDFKQTVPPMDFLR